MKEFLKQNKILTSFLLVILLSIIVFSLEALKVTDLNRNNSATKDTKADQQKEANINPAKSVDMQPATEEEKNESDQRKDEIVNPKPAEDNSLGITITRAAQDPLGSTAGDMIRIRALVDGVTSGTCTAKLTKGDLLIKKSVTVVQQATYYACQAIDIPRNEFAEAGTWSLELTLAQGSSVKGSSQEIVVQ